MGSIKFLGFRISSMPRVYDPLLCKHAVETGRADHVAQELAIFN